MKLRRTYIALAVLTTATFVLGVAALRFLPSAAPHGAPNPALQTISAAAPAEPVTLDRGLAGPFLLGLRGRTAAEAAPPPPDESMRLFENPVPLQEAAPALASLEAAAPPPPKRPADLASLSLANAPLPPPRPQGLATGAEAAPPEAPLPPPRPQGLATGAEAAPPEAPAAAPSVMVEAPLPPARPRELAPPAAPAAPAATTEAAPPAAKQPTTEVVAYAAPPEASEPSKELEQAPVRFNMGAPVYVRIFKKEGELELWLKTNGRYRLYRNFPICKWSGRLGPKLKEADYQSPEGFYSVSAKQLHPNSNYHRAFNVGYPNAFDRQNGRTGGMVMVHGNCKSVGCFAMTDKGVEEIYGFVAAALAGGQREVPVHIFPFRMTDSTLARETGGSFLSFLATDSANGAQWAGFWRNLKEGYDLFERTGEPPTAYACGDHYAFDANASCTRVAGW